jgi:hypothetical protein
MNTRAFLVLTLLALSIGACVNDVSGPQMALPPGGASFDGTKLVLEANLYRDFMPILLPEDVNGRPMTAVLRVRAVDGEPLPPGLTLGDAVVTLGSAVWRTQPMTMPSNDPGMLLGRSVNGPKWGPGVIVDVELTVKQGVHQTATLRAQGVLVQRTD